MNIGPAPSPPWFGSVAVDGWGGRWGAEGEVGDEEEKEGEVRGDGAHRRGRARKEWQKKRKPFHVHSGHQLGWHLMWKWLKCFKDIHDLFSEKSIAKLQVLCGRCKWYGC